MLQVIKKFIGCVRRFKPAYPPPQPGRETGSHYDDECGVQDFEDQVRLALGCRGIRFSADTEVFDFLTPSTLEEKKDEKSKPSDSQGWPGREELCA